MSILVVGSLHLDVVVTAPQLPALDETVTGAGVEYVFGGKGGNQAVAAARMGATVAFAGRAGDDSFGDLIRETLAVSRVNTDQLQKDEGPSGMSTAIVNADGDYGAVIVSAANLNIQATEIEVPKSTGIVLLQNEIPENVNVAVAHKAKECGARVWLNAAPARDLPADLIDAVDMLIVNRVEAEYYSDLAPKGDVLTTLGADGVRYRNKVYPGYSVTVVSTHGAGDVFVGALATQVVAGDSLIAAIKFAQAAAALHVSTDVSHRADLSAKTVRQFMENQDRR